MSNRREKFIELAEKRVTRAIRDLRLNREPFKSEQLRVH